MPKLKLYLFGSPRIECRGKSIDLGLRKATALLVYLAVTGRKVSRDELAAMFWPESDPSSARANLRRAIYIINKQAAEEVLATGMETVYLDPGVCLWTDVEAFRTGLTQALPADPSDLVVEAWGIACLEEAVASYQADFLAGFSLPDSPGFDEWQFFESENLRGLLVQALQALVSAYCSKGDPQSAIAHARRWISLDNLHESAHRLLMELYAQAGQYAAALRQFKECERILEQELGVAPQPETIQAYELLRLGRDHISAPTVRAPPLIRYVASGDVHISYVVMGDGPIDILWVLGYITHMEHVWELPQIVDFYEKLSAYCRVILFDRRGVGLSDRVGYAPTMEDTLDDILAVMRAVGSRHPVLFGYLEGGPTSILFTATYPEYVSGLILYGTRAKWTRSQDYPWALTREQYDRWLQHTIEHWGEPLNLDAYAPQHANEPELQEWWAKLMRLASSPGAVKAVLDVMKQIDVREILPVIRVPTLIMQRRGDRAMRVGAGRHLAGKIPGAKYVELEGDDHWYFFGDTVAILDEVHDFIRNLGSPIVPECMLATILLFEIGSVYDQPTQSEIAQMQSGSSFAYLRQEVARFRGSEVSCKNGCFMATFDGPTRAIHCAKAIMGTARQWGVRLRAGLHTGECEFIAGKLVGIAVQIVEGVMSCAGNHEILVSSTVVDLVVGSGCQFSQRGEQVIEGVSGRWRVFAVKD